MYAVEKKQPKLYDVYKKTPHIEIVICKKIQIQKLIFI